MKNKIKTLLAKEWLIIISFVFIGSIISGIWYIGEKNFCYKTTDNIEILNEREIKVNDFLKEKLNANKYIDYEIRDLLARNNDDLKNIINLCNEDFKIHLSSVPLFDIEIEDILYKLWIIYVLLLSLRIFIFFTKKSIEIIKTKER